MFAFVDAILKLIKFTCYIRRCPCGHLVVVQCYEKPDCSWTVHIFGSEGVSFVLSLDCPTSQSYRLVSALLLLAKQQTYIKSFSLLYLLSVLDFNSLYNSASCVK